MFFCKREEFGRASMDWHANSEAKRKYYDSTVEAKQICCVSAYKIYLEAAK